MVENMDETHLVINMDNSKNFSFIGYNYVKYADIISAGEGMTKVVPITGGPRAFIQPPYMIFQNKSRNFPIRGVPHDIPSVSYRTVPKACLDRHTFMQWLSDPRAIYMDIYGMNCFLWIIVGSCSKIRAPREAY